MSAGIWPVKAGLGYWRDELGTTAWYWPWISTEILEVVTELFPLGLDLGGCSAAACAKAQSYVLLCRVDNAKLCLILGL